MAADGQKVTDEKHAVDAVPAYNEAIATEKASSVAGDGVAVNEDEKPSPTVAAAEEKPPQSTLSLVMVTVALMSGTFLVALDTNILGKKQDWHFLRSTQLTKSSYRNPSNHHRVQQPRPCHLVWRRLLALQNGLPAILWPAVLSFPPQDRLLRRHRPAHPRFHHLRSGPDL
jgi:hypothetical protein